MNTIPVEPTPEILPDVPDAETVRRRLAVVLTEADLLRAQLRVSTRLERERERLRRLAAPGAAGDAATPTTPDGPDEGPAGGKRRRF
jgi:hypothetical protein